MVDIKRWNSSAASNTLSPPDGAPEGWAPADVNNVIREIMGAVRRQYEDPDFTDYDHTPTFVTAISFTVSGDHTARYAVDRRIRAAVGGSLLYGDIISATATGGVTTTVIVELDTGSLTSSLTGVAVGILTPAGHPSIFHNRSLSGDLDVSGQIRAGRLSVSGAARITGTTNLGFVSISGNAVVSGQLIAGTVTVSGTVVASQIRLGADPTVSLGASTKQYTDAVVEAGTVMLFF